MKLLQVCREHTLSINVSTPDDGLHDRIMYIGAMWLYTNSLIPRPIFWHALCGLVENRD